MFFFLNFEFVFEILTENRFFFQKNSEYLSNCNMLVIYQWIRLNELYKLMESLFQISFLNFGQKQKNLAKNRKMLKRIARREY